MRKTLLIIAASAVLSACGGGDNAKNSGGPLALNDLGYFERQGVNVLIFFVIYSVLFFQNIAIGL